MDVLYCTFCVLFTESQLLSHFITNRFTMSNSWIADISRLVGARAAKKLCKLRTHLQRSYVQPLQGDCTIQAFLLGWNESLFWWSSGSLPASYQAKSSLWPGGTGIRGRPWPIVSIFARWIQVRRERPTRPDLPRPELSIHHLPSGLRSGNVATPALLGIASTEASSGDRVTQRT